LKSVGRNCTLLLNIPPDTTGRFHPTDVERLYAFSDTLASIFDEDLISSSSIVEASSAGENYQPSNATDGNWDSFWIASEEDQEPSLTLNFDNPTTFDLLVLQEFIPIGQRIAEFEVSVPDGDGWQTIASGTTVGHKRILSLDETTAQKLRITFLESDGRPAVNEVAVYLSGPM
jgi:alpha-L-fucosidase